MMKHLEEVNETYFEHMVHALKFALLGFIASFCCLVHAFIPCWFETTASKIFKSIASKAETRS